MYEKFINFFKKLSAHTGVKVYSENLFFLITEKVIRIIVGLFVGIYVARSLTPKYYGIFNYIIAYVTIFSIFSLSFLNNIAIREMAKDENNCGKILGSLKSIKFFASLIMVLVIIGSTYIIPMENDTRYLIWLFSIGAFFAGAEYYSTYFIFKRKNRIIATASLVVFLIISLFRVYFAYQNMPLASFIALETLFLCGMVLFLKIAFVRQSTFKLQNDHDELKNFINAGKILFFASIFTAITSKAELIVLKELVNNIDLGIYTVAMRITETFTFVSIALGNTFFPSISNSKNVSEELYCHRLTLYIGLVFYINLLCCIGIIVLSPFFAMLYGKSYAGVIPLIILYSLRLPFCGIITPMTQHFYIENKIKYMTFFAFISMILTIILTIILTQKFGLYGAAIVGLPINFALIFILPFITGEKQLGKLIIKSFTYLPEYIIEKIKN